MSVLPERIGRFDVTARLAAGGMAEIMLGRLTGPSGFERAVVIKRIHPHLALSAEFQEMFLDEARIVARIHHPNVVHVHELGQEGEELYLVMEYVAGESCAGIQRRSMVRKKRLPPALAAFIVAEACAGIHAAHELRGPGGEVLALIHRDISPQNILVGYDGSVKVIDFGIAKAENRIVQTEAGVVKGKFAYMSPEQSRGDSIDRRSDIFALGVVLYELLTAKRLFKRANQPATLKALWSLEITPPATLDRAISPELEAVCMRALNRDPAQRFDTAAAMREGLLAALRGAPDAPAAPEQALTRYMDELFKDRIAAKKAMLHRVSEGARITDVPAAEADSGVEIPTVEGASVPLVRTEPKRSRTIYWIATAAALAGGIGYLGSSMGRGESPKAAAAPAVQAESAPAPPPASVAKAPAKDVSLHIGSKPGGATVHIDGVEKGQTPLELTLPRSDSPAVVELSKPGFKSTRERVGRDRDQRIKLTLSPEPSPRAKPARAAPRPSAEKPAFERWR